MIKNLCENCYKLEPSFEIGDEVVTATGQKGLIVDICKCEACKRRGVYMLKVKVESGIDKYIYITDADMRTGTYEHINKQELLSQIVDKKQELNKNMVDCDALLRQAKNFN